ncbi:MAG: Sec-independent protein translocase protein TatB [bacterium]
MEFLGIGYQELLLVLVLLLVVVGPERLPTMAYQIGRAVRQMQGYARAVRDEFKDEIDYLDEQYRTVKGHVDEAQKVMRTEQIKMNQEFRETSVDSGGILPAEPLLPALPNLTAPTADSPIEPVVSDKPAQPPMVF